MGPRLFSRGNHHDDEHSSRDGARFNGAAAFQPRKYHQASSSFSEYIPLQWGRGFSAAEICRSGPGEDPIKELQWGRGFSAAEIRNLSPVVDKSTCASMGPRLFSRGNQIISQQTLSHGSGFNGAAAFQPRKSTYGLVCCRRSLSASMGPRLFSRGNQREPAQNTSPRTASMGPRLFSRGNGSSDGGSARSAIMLQWGRGFSAAEISSSFSEYIPVDMASMGPRLFSRGNGRQNKSHVNDTRRFNGAAAFQPRKLQTSSRIRAY